MSDGTIQFEFKEIGLEEIFGTPMQAKIPDSLIGWCVAENRNPQVPTPSACGVE